MSYQSRVLCLYVVLSYAVHVEAERQRTAVANCGMFFTPRNTSLLHLFTSILQFSLDIMERHTWRYCQRMWTGLQRTWAGLQQVWADLQKTWAGLQQTWAGLDRQYPALSHAHLQQHHYLARNIHTLIFIDSLPNYFCLPSSDGLLLLARLPSSPPAHSGSSLSTPSLGTWLST